MGSVFFSKRIFRGKKTRGERQRPKSFTTPEKAKRYAEQKGIKDYSIELRGKKYIISAQESSS